MLGCMRTLMIMDMVTLGHTRARMHVRLHVPLHVHMHTHMHITYLYQ